MADGELDRMDEGQEKKKPRKNSPWFWIILAAAGVAFWYWTGRPSKLWKVELGGPAICQAAVSYEAVYVCAGSSLRVFDSVTGREMWKFSRSDYPYMVGPPVVIGRNVFVWSSKLHSLGRETGDEMWQELSQEVFCPAGEDIVYGGWHSVIARDAATGRDRWTVSLDKTKTVEGIAVYDNTVLVGYSEDAVPSAAAGRSPGGAGGVEAWDSKAKVRLWTADLGTAIKHSPVKIGEIVFAVDNGLRFRSLIAFDTASQQVSWQAKSGRLILPELANVSTQVTDQAIGTVTQPAAFRTSVIAGFSDEYGDVVKCFDFQTGELTWRYEIDWEICPQKTKDQPKSALTTPVVSGKSVYFGAGPYLVKLNAGTGREKWRFKTESGGFIRHAPAVMNGIVYFGSDKGDFYAVSTGD
ncbi:MAG: hypothetical protein C0404_01645 [Verrucomicrobia bacterium]|nr:hypothetical protein [Verrucomicrobiota bacterium]